jgi:hypothetical protein
MIAKLRSGILTCVLYAIAVTPVCVAQSSFVFVEEVLPTTNASELITQAFVGLNVDYEWVSQTTNSGPYWSTSSAGAVAAVQPKCSGTAGTLTGSDPDWQPEVKVLNQFTAQIVMDPLYIEELAEGTVATTSRTRKGWLNTDITPPENSPGTPCLGADWEFKFQTNPGWGAFLFEGGLWMTEEGQHWNQATHLADILGSNGILGGDNGWYIVDSAGENLPGTHYSEETDLFVWTDRFPQIQPGTVIWIMGRRDENGEPLPHAILTTENWLSAGNYGPACSDQCLGYYWFTPSLTASWNGGGAN